ncbi:MAG: cation:proton antiporter [Mycobacterium sp.]
MIPSLIALAAVVACWALVARRLDRCNLTAPMVFVAAGIVIGFFTEGQLVAALNTDDMQRVAEIILAVLLFVDATEVKGGIFGRDVGSAARLLFVALPLSLAATVVVGGWLLPGTSWPVLLLIACIVIPSDFAPAAAILRDPRIPERVRDLLNVEGGYNDGIASPVFIFALVLAGDVSQAETPHEALGTAVPHALIAIAVGAVLGSALALLTNLAEHRGVTTDQAKRMLLVATPLLAYAVSVAAHGNGFVSAFVAGIAFNLLRHAENFHSELEFLDDVAFMLTLVMWFVFGGVTVVALSGGVPWRLALFCLLALTLLRIVPVGVALLGTSFGWRDRLMIGWLGPRGTASIVLGLLAFNVLGSDDESVVLVTMVAVVLGSVLLHGVGSPAAARSYARSG